MVSAVDPASVSAVAARARTENFPVASLLFPRPLRPHLRAVYGFARLVDILGDELEGDRLAALDELERELDACYSDTPSWPVMVVLQPTIREFALPRERFLRLIEANRIDQRRAEYETWEDLREYCRHSANPVGRLVLYLAEVYDEGRAALSDHVCTALQLANFWQDVARDFDMGRVYLPEEDRKRFGYRDEDLEGRRCTPAFMELLRFEVDRTRELFYRGYPLVGQMPPELRSDTELFIEGGLAVLRKIERCGYDVWSRRPALARWEKGVLLAGALWRRLRPHLRVW
jgi:squalene synthase HpnC